MGSSRDRLQDGKRKRRRQGGLCPSSCPALCRASTSCFVAAKSWMAGTSPAMTNSTTRNLVHRARELDVQLGHAARVMRRERHLDGLVDVEPFGMMIHLFGDERGPRHEAERRVEILE